MIIRSFNVWCQDNNIMKKIETTTNNKEKRYVRNKDIP